MGFQNPIVGGTALRIPAIQSPNFATGVDGWIIRIDGSAEFNNLVLRGIGTGDILIVGTSPNPQVIIGNTAGVGYIKFPTNRPIESSEAVILAGSFNTGAANEYLSLQIKGPIVSGSPGQARIQINSDSQDGTILAGVLFTANIEAPRVAVAPVSGNANGLFLNSTGTHTGNLFKLQQSSSDKFVVSNAGNITHTGDTTHTGNVEVSGNITRNSVDLGHGIQSKVALTSNVTGITGTETVLMTIPSMTFVNGRAYRVSLWGLAQSSTASTYYLYRVRKGSATTTGTIYKDLLRIPVLGTANTDSVVNMVFNLVNNSGADVTTALTWTASMAAGTGQFTASSSNVAHATVEDVGLSSAWPGNPVT